MILDKVLILKGLAGVTTIGSAVTVGVVGHINNWWRDLQLTPEEIKTGLGLPDDNCNLPTDSNPTTCSSINTEKLKAINFEGKGSSEPSITGSGTVTLTITKTSDTTTFPQGYKFSFNPTEEVTISSTPSLKIAKNSNTEFKIKKVDKKLTLEKAWTAKSLGEKVGLLCENSNNNKDCSLPTSKNINVAFSSSDKSSKTIQDTDISKKLKYEEDAADHNQGLKFYIEENGQEITFSSNDNKKIEKKSSSGTPTYEIKEIEGKWYLAKRANGG